LTKRLKIQIIKPGGEKMRENRKYDDEFKREERRCP